MSWGSRYLAVELGKVCAKASNSLQDAYNGLLTALSAVDVSGDVATASSNLERANIILSIVLNILAPLVGEPG